MRRLIVGLVGVAIVLSQLETVTQGATIETVSVGNERNAGELSGEGAGGVGPDRISGAVDYTYEIGKYEVTTGQYTEFLNAVAATDTYGLYSDGTLNTVGSQIRQSGSSGNYTYLVDANGDGIEDTDRVNRPVNYVSWGSAARFANWMHNGQLRDFQNQSTTEDGSYHLNGATSWAALQAVIREPDATWVIPSEDEWYKAAYYDGDNSLYYDYPTGTDLVPGRDMSEVTTPGNNANYDGNPIIWIDLPYYQTLVGEFELSESPYGTFDQGGNLTEWTEATETSASGFTRGLRGGGIRAIARFMSASHRNEGTPTITDFSVGFRVARVPEPSTFALLAMATVGLLVYTRRRR